MASAAVSPLPPGAGATGAAGADARRTYVVATLAGALAPPEQRVMAGRGVGEGGKCDLSRALVHAPRATSRRGHLCMR